MIADLFFVGAHFGYKKASRHPTMQPYMYGTKDDHEIIDLYKTKEQLEKAQTWLADTASNGGTVLFVGGKNEAHEPIARNAADLGMPYVAGRWVGGTITNFKQIRRQVDKLQSLRTQKEKGELAKYTKYEQLAFDREIEDLARYYDGLIPLTSTPKIMVVVDPKQEQIAVHEAQVAGIPVVAIASTDCDIRGLGLVIPANDNSAATIQYLLDTIGSRLSNVAQTQSDQSSSKTQTASHEHSETATSAH